MATLRRAAPLVLSCLALILVLLAVLWLPGVTRAENRLSAPVAAPNADSASLAWVNIASEGFEGAFPPAKWSTNGSPTWGRLFWQKHNGTYSAWCAWQGHTGEGTDYFPNMDARMTYGPFDLTNASNAELRFWYWLNTEAGYDYLYVRVYTGEAPQTVWSATGGGGGWGEAVLSLNSFVGRSGVSIQFRFTSDASVQYKGAFVDDVLLRYEPIPTATMTRTPSPTPTLSRTPSHTPTRTLTPTGTITLPPTRTNTPTLTPSRTPTRTPSRTPSRTPTRTRTSTPLPDLIADKIEVTQGIQDLQNSVRLVAGKRTYVRFYVKSASGDHRTSAVLVAQSGIWSARLRPVNAGGSIVVIPSPDRFWLDDSFLFELPSFLTEGSLTLRPYLNNDHSPAEINYDNNTISPVTVEFESVPALNLIIYRTSYTLNNTKYTTSKADGNALATWLRRAYPISTLNVKFRDLNFTKAETDAKGNLTSPNSDEVLARLNTLYLLELLDASEFTQDLGSLRYAMVTDKGGFMRGASFTPSVVACGPTGSTAARFTWDGDGTYGDWYGGHELGHALGRPHTLCSGEKDAVSQNPGGSISPVTSGDKVMFGFNIGTQAVYDTDWTDVMTYCDWEWISGATYQALLDSIKKQMGYQASAFARSRVSAAALADQLAVIGSIYPATGQPELEPMFVVPQSAPLQSPTPGPYAIVLLGAGGSELARYAFTPLESHVDGPPTSAQLDERGDPTLLINEVVPYADGTVRVDIEGPGGVILASVQPGASRPTVSLISPNGGETLTAEEVTVSWTSGDADGDPLSHLVMYSPDNGQSWSAVAQDVTGQSVVIPVSNLPAGDQAIFRVWVTDGLNTATDASDAPFTVPNHLPEVEILGPRDGLTIAVSQTLHLSAMAYDADTGSMDGEAVVWQSDLDGALGTGAELSITGLSVGEHIISVKADDGQGGASSAAVHITVVATIEELPMPGVYLPLLLKSASLAAYPLPGATATLLPGQKRVLFDETHDEEVTLSWERALTLDVEHPSAVYFGRLQADLADEFVLTRHAAGPLTADVLAGYDALWLAMPRSNLSDEEFAAVEQFLKNGGGVLVQIYDEEVARSLLRGTGITLDPTMVIQSGGTGEFLVSDLADHPALTGADHLTFTWGGSLEVTEPAAWLLRTGGDIYRDTDRDFQHDDGEPVGPFVVAAAHESDAERLVVGTTRAFQNDGYDAHANTPMARAWLRWLTQRE